MDVVRHHYIGVELVVPFPLSIVDGFDYYSCDVGAAKVQRTRAGGVEKDGSIAHEARPEVVGGGKARFAGRLRKGAR